MNPADPARKGGVATVSWRLTFLLFMGMECAFAQISGLPDITGKEKQPAVQRTNAQVDYDQLRANTEVELDKLRKSLKTARTRQGPSAPSGITPDEIEQGQTDLRLLEYLYLAQIETIAKIKEQRNLRAEAEATERSWIALTETPPYSIHLSDRIREEVDVRRNAVSLLQSSQAQTKNEIERAQEKTKGAQEALRRTIEAVEQTPNGSTARTAANWRVAAARNRAKTNTELVAVASLVTEEVGLRVAAEEARLRLAVRKQATLAGKVTFTRENLDAAYKHLDKVRQQYQKELHALVAQVSKQASEHDRVSARLEALRKAQPAHSSVRQHERTIQLEEARLRAIGEQIDSLRLQIRIHNVLTETYHKLIAEAWEKRFVILTEGEAAARLEARQEIERTIGYLRTWGSRGQSLANEVRSSLREQEHRVELATDPKIRQFEALALDALRTSDLALDRQQALVTARLAMFDRWKQDFDQAAASRSFTDIAQEMAARLAAMAKKVWDYELLTIEDSVEVGGQRVATTRGITVGKSIGAALLFLVGLRLTFFLSSGMERLMIRRFEMNPELSISFRRWINALGVVILLLITLNLARIPLTVFAFAGGAMAIGIGFGTQTLIKNLISGMIVLVERQIRVGDIIEAEGVTGTVTMVNFRSSTVRGFDGVESMIPNSTLLEQKVTNWTLTNAHLRRSIRIGVAYGSPGREVARLLAVCANQHAAVLQQPPPRVIFEDFGDSALIFNLYFWLNLTADTNTLQVMSELRFLIDEALADAGIVIAFPQQDIHLDTAQPLKIEMITPESGRA